MSCVCLKEASMSKRTCSRGHTSIVTNGVCAQCLLIAEGNGDLLDRLRAEVREYCSGYVARGMQAEGIALDKLRKAAEG